MKTLRLFVLTFALLAFTPILFAQNNYDSYLQTARQRLTEGDCSGAQKYYNVYKELSGKELTSFEDLIDDCMAENRFRIGDKIDVNGENYIIAYLTKNKQHGFAIKDMGIMSLCTQETLRYIKEHRIPSLEELNSIYKNNGDIGLTGIYWTRSVYGSSSYDYYYTIDFLTGKQGASDQRNNNGILLIHRF